MIVLAASVLLLTGCAERGASGEEASDAAAPETALEEVTEGKEEITLAWTERDESSGETKNARDADKTTVADAAEERITAAATTTSAAAAEKTETKKSDSEKNGTDGSGDKTTASAKPTERNETATAGPREKTDTGGDTAPVSPRATEPTKAGWTGGAHELPAIPLG